MEGGQGPSQEGRAAHSGMEDTGASAVPMESVTYSGDGVHYHASTSTLTYLDNVVTATRPRKPRESAETYPFPDAEPATKRRSASARPSTQPPAQHDPLADGDGGGPPGADPAEEEKRREREAAAKRATARAQRRENLVNQITANQPDDVRRTLYHIGLESGPCDLCDYGSAWRVCRDCDLRCCVHCANSDKDPHTAGKRGQLHFQVETTREGVRSVVFPNTVRRPAAYVSVCLSCLRSRAHPLLSLVPRAATRSCLGRAGASWTLAASLAPRSTSRTRSDQRACWTSSRCTVRQGMLEPSRARTCPRTNRLGGTLSSSDAITAIGQISANQKRRTCGHCGKVEDPSACDYKCTAGTLNSWVKNDVLDLFMALRGHDSGLSAEAFVRSLDTRGTPAARAVPAPAGRLCELTAKRPRRHALCGRRRQGRRASVQRAGVPPGIRALRAATARTDRVQARACAIHPRCVLRMLPCGALT